VLQKTSLIRSYIAAVLLSLAAAASASASPATGKFAGIAIDNFGQVDDHYYRGAQPHGRDYADLAALGIKTVIDLDGSDSTESDLVERAGMTFFRMPMTTHDQPAATVVARFLSIVNDAAKQPVYVHCVGGRHRTGVMTAVYRMTQDHWNADRAFAEMQQYRFGPAYLHSELKKFVYTYFDGLANAVAAPGEAVKR
jgi:protein tyrosine/serine phosphatase